MMKYIKTMSVLGLCLGVMLTMTSCKGEKVTVPSASYAAVKTKDGWQKDGAGEIILYEPSTFRMPWNPFNPPQLVVIEAGHFDMEEKMTLYMPKDELNMEFDVRGTLGVNKDYLRDLLSNIKPEPLNPGAFGGGNKFVITTSKVYQVYGQQLLRNRVRAEIVNHTIMEVMQNRETIDKDLFSMVGDGFTGKRIPLEPVQFGLADVQPPALILEAQEIKRQKEVELERAETDKLIRLRQAEADLEVAVKQQEVDLIEAQTQVEVEAVLSGAVNDAFVTQRALKIWDQLSKNDNKDLIFVPSDAFNDPSFFLGAQMKAYQK